MKFTTRYEQHSQPLLPRPQFVLRLIGHALVALAILTFALGIGILGYHYAGELPWIDALVNASMILGGMGPVDVLRTIPGKLFASAYALFAGVVFLATFGIVLAPIAHRFLHSLHLSAEDS